MKEAKKVGENCIMALHNLFSSTNIRETKWRTMRWKSTLHGWDRWEMQTNTWS